jgi:hypothetical protein
MPSRRPHRYLMRTMESLKPAASPEEEANADSDLARRLARYRRRVEAEDRPRSVKVIDRAIEDAGKKRGPRK